MLFTRWSHGRNGPIRSIHFTRYIALTFTIQLCPMSGIYWIVLLSNTISQLWSMSNVYHLLDDTVIKHNNLTLGVMSAIYWISPLSNTISQLWPMPAIYCMAVLSNTISRLWPMSAITTSFTPYTGVSCCWCTLHT